MFAFCSSCNRWHMYAQRTFLFFLSSQLVTSASRWIILCLYTQGRHFTGQINCPASLTKTDMIIIFCRPDQITAFTLNRSNNFIICDTPLDYYTRQKVAKLPKQLEPVQRSTWNHHLFTRCKWMCKSHEPMRCTTNAHNLSTSVDRLMLGDLLLFNYETDSHQFQVNALHQAMFTICTCQYVTWGWLSYMSFSRRPMRQVNCAFDPCMPGNCLLPSQTWFAFYVSTIASSTMRGPIVICSLVRQYVSFKALIDTLNIIHRLQQSTVASIKMA